MRRSRLLVTLSLLAVSAAACSGARTTGSGATSGGIVLRLAALTQSGGFPTPYAAIRGPGRLVSTYLFDTLAFPDSTGDPKPWLATSWTSSPDGKTWTFLLHDKARFTDGTPLTSDDVVFTFDYNLKGPGAATGVARGVDYIDTVTAPDPTTVVIKLKTVRPSFLSDIAGAFGFAVVPKHIWATVTDPARFQEPKALIGSGPYILKKYDLSKNSFDFVANNDFYLGKPAVQQLQIVPTGNPLLALQQGDIDAASGGNALIPKAQYDALAAKFKVFTAPGEFSVELFFNPDKGFPYNERAFRQGVVYALNRQDMIDRLLAGRGVPGSAGQLGPGNPFLDTSLPDYPFDKAKAQSLLDSIGLRDANGDGLRERPDGSPFTIPLSTSSADAKQAQLVKEYLGAVGLDVRIDAVDQQTSDARGASGDYAMAVQHFGGLSADPSNLIETFSSTSKSKSFTRVHGYRNPAFDQVARQQAVELDPQKRRQLVNRMQQILAEDVPRIPLYVPQQVSFGNEAKFKGFAYTPGCPPCGIAGNKRNLVSGNANPVPGG